MSNSIQLIGDRITNEEIDDKVILGIPNGNCNGLEVGVKIAKITTESGNKVLNFLGGKFMERTYTIPLLPLGEGKICNNCQYIKNCHHAIMELNK